MASLKTLISIYLIAFLILLSESLPTSSAAVHGGASNSLDEILRRNILQTMDHHQVDHEFFFEQKVGRRTRRSVVRDDEAPSPSTANQLSRTSSFAVGSMLSLFIVFGLFMWMNDCICYYLFALFFIWMKILDPIYWWKEKIGLHLL